MQRKIKELELASAGILARVFHDVSDDVNGFSTVAKSKYFSKRIAVEEGPRQPYLAITFTFLQEEENYRESLDSEVLEAVKNSLESHKFSDKVKDVVVNLSQVRDAILEA